MYVSVSFRLYITIITLSVIVVVCYYIIIIIDIIVILVIVVVTVAIRCSFNDTIDIHIIRIMNDISIFLFVYFLLNV